MPAKFGSHGSRRSQVRSVAERQELLARAMRFSGLGFLFVTVVALFAYAAGNHSWWTTLALLIFIALASTAVGALIGFLFAIPRANRPEGVSRERPNSGYRVNTNLEDISDWLTKIIVGLGLVELTNVLHGFGVLNDSLAKGLDDNRASHALVGTEIVLFGITGFLFSYVTTRTYLALTFRYYDDIELDSVAAPLANLLSSLTQRLAAARAGISATMRRSPIDGRNILPHHHREPAIPAPPIASSVNNFVHLMTKIEGLLAELVLPISPGGANLGELTKIATNRGILDRDSAQMIKDLELLAMKVASGEQLHEHDQNAVMNYGPAVVEELGAIRNLAPAMFEQHVIKVLNDQASSRGWLVDHDVMMNETGIDAVVSDDRKSVIFEVRARLNADVDQLTAVYVWLESLPPDILVLLVIPAEFEGFAFRRRSGLDVLVWDTESAQLSTRIETLLNSHEMSTLDTRD